MRQPPSGAISPDGHVAAPADGSDGRLFLVDLESGRKTAHTRVTPNGHAYAVDLRTGDVRDLLPTVEGIRQVAVRP